MQSAIAVLGLVAGLAIGAPAGAQSLASLSNQDAVAGLKDALIQSSGKAVSQLGAADGFLGDAKVKIPLPDSIKRVESALRMVGMGKQADELVVSMNRAAEMAVKEATPILTDSVRKMSVQDAKGILTGGDDSATQYFRRTTSEQLTQRFLPIVKKMTAKVQLAEQYNNLAGQAATFGLVKQEDANIDNYVTRKALDGLFFVIAEQERAIRKDPVGAATGMAKKVFGMLGK
ncbi:MAG TPA: DUF4197 domain-containing protein [Burkholderiales bacterium]|nr:DUF4197 domain-containing protein [Burkholderiales bacterium]